MTGYRTAAALSVAGLVLLGGGLLSQSPTPPALGEPVVLPSGEAGNRDANHPASPRSVDPRTKTLAQGEDGGQDDASDSDEAGGDGGRDSVRQGAPNGESGDRPRPSAVEDFEADDGEAGAGAHDEESDDDERDDDEDEGDTEGSSRD